MNKPSRLLIGVVGAVLISIVAMAGSRVNGKAQVVSQSTDAAGTLQGLDPSGANVCITEFANDNHNSKLFSYSALSVDLADNASFSVLLMIPTNKHCHANFSVTSAGAAIVYVYEGAVTSSPGTVSIPVCLNRTQVFAADTLMYGNPTVSSTVTVMAVYFLQGGEKQAAVGAAAESGTEFILASGSNYYFRMINIAGSAKTSAGQLLFSEEDND